VFILGTRIGAGKTVVASTLCLLLRQRAVSVGAFKPIDFACQRRQRQGLVSADAELLAHFADSPLELAAICPLRLERVWYAKPSRQALRWTANWETMWKEYRRNCEPADVMVVEGCGGAMTPLDARKSQAELAGEFGLDVVLVAPSGPDVISEVLGASEALKASGVTVRDVVINRYEPDKAGAAEERAAEVIAGRLGGRLPVVVPTDKSLDLRTGKIGRSIRFPLSLWVDRWLASRVRGRKAE
jgi:dethiobiotin synthetase